jgi:WD40 repeat protein
MARCGYGNGRAIVKRAGCDSRQLGIGFRNRDSRNDMRGFASFAWTPVIPVAGVDPNSVPSQDTRHPVGPVTKIIAPHPSKPLLAVYGSLDEILISECLSRDFRELHRLPVSGVVTDLAFAGDGDKLAATISLGVNAGAIYRWHSMKRTPMVIDCKGDEGSAILFSPNGENLYCGFASGRLVWWKMVQRVSPQTAVVSPSKIVDMAFSPDGRTLLFGCEDGLVRLWDVAAQHPQVTFDWVIGSIRCVAFAPDGLTAAVGGDGAIIVWDVDD